MRTVKLNIGIPVVLFVCFVVSLPFLITENSQIRAHGDLLERSRTNQARVNLNFDRNGDFYRVIVENNLFRHWAGRHPNANLSTHWLQRGLNLAVKLPKLFWWSGDPKNPITRL